MNKPKIWLSSPHMGASELEFVRDVFESNWIAPVGPHLSAFERDLCDYVHVKHAAAVSSGTAAIHLALIILGIAEGDEVICQSFTFSGSANPIRYQGSIPVFVDSEAATWNMCPELLLDTIQDRIAKGKKPKAIIMVHLYGMPAKMKEILDIADRFEIPIIEDAAEALGARYFGGAMGGLGRFGILSFNGNKIITTSSGGALLSNDAELIEQARHLATQARDPAPHYQHTVVGYNYRMSNVLAGIGRGQMQVLNERVQQRRANHEFYKNALKAFPGISFLDEPEGHFANRWLTTIQVDPEKTGGVSREDLRLALDAENIESRPLWKPMHMQPVFQEYPAYKNGVSERLFELGLCLPSGSNLTDEDRERVKNVLLERLGGSEMGSGS